MAKYEVTSPDGQNYEIEAPDTASDAEVMAYAQQQFSPPQTEAAPNQPVKTASKEDVEFALNRLLRAGRPVEEAEQYLAETVNPSTNQPWAAGEWGGGKLDEWRRYFQMGGENNLSLDVVGPDGLPSNKAAAVGRGLLDAVTFDWGDELTAMLRSGQLTGPEYEQAWQEEQQRRAADPGAERGLGEALGVIGSAAVPARAFGALPAALTRAGANPIARGAATLGSGAAYGGATSALTAAGQANLGESTDNLGGPAMAGAVGGAGLAAAAPLGRRMLQTFGALPQATADDVVRGSMLQPEELRRRAEDFYRREGRGPSVQEILTPEEAAQFTRAIGPADEATKRVQQNLLSQRETLPPALRRQILDDPNSTPNAVALPGEGGRVPGQRPAIHPDELKRQRDDAAKIEFGAIKEAPVDLRGGDLLLFEEILNDSPLRTKVKREIQEKLARGNLTVNDLETVRLSLQTPGQGGAGRPFQSMRDDVVDLMEGAVPQARVPIERYRRRSEFTGGTDRYSEGGATLGRQAAAGNVDPDAFADVAARQTAEGRAGTEAGFRGGAARVTRGAPIQSYQWVRRAGEDTGFQENIRASLPEQEAEELIAFAVGRKNMIESAAALANVPKHKIETVMNDANELAGAIAAMGTGATAWAARLFARALVRDANVGAGAANRLAEDLINPERFDRAVKLLADRKVSRTTLTSELQGLFLAIGAREAGYNPAEVDPIYAIEEPE